MRRFITGFAALVLLALPIHAQRVQEQMLVSPDWLQRRLGIVTVLHVGDAASYDARHIPGAVLIEMSSLLAQRNGTPNELPPIDALERLFRAAGVNATGRIVVYSIDPLLAARAWFTLDYLGQGSRVSLLDGGLAKWMAAGYAISSEKTAPRSGTFEARPVPQTIAPLSTMRELVRLREQLGPNLVLIDARSSEQFCGDEAGPDVAHPGRIPGAVNVPYASNLDGTGALRPVADLRAIYHRAGVTRESANVVYCRTGMQASMTYFVLRYLGYDVTLYDGSFVEWSNAGEMIFS
ncbi:MAG TPA: sulfurtransferase [Thermoanaerobaculia bacterium]|nr:sulfurtransferase [Thermoanaerobaculia bacterium]